MAKKSKKKKNKGGGPMFGNPAAVGAAAIATELIGNALGQILADGLERYFGKGAGKKKLKKRLKKLTSLQAS